MHHRALSISVWLRDTHDGLFGPFPVTARELPNVDELGNWGTEINPLPLTLLSPSNPVLPCLSHHKQSATYALFRL